MAEDNELALKKAELQASNDKARIIAGAVVSSLIVLSVAAVCIANIQNQANQETNPENAE